MPAPTQPFALPEKLPSTLASIYGYWNTLIRGENTMPFSDDVNLSQLSELSHNLILAEVFAEPQRFRFSYLGEQLVRQLGSNLKDRFADELELHSPLDFFVAQSSVTVEARAPTWYSCGPANSSEGRTIGYSRILLPTWGNGRIELLLGAVI
jgi:hypothetical protein